MKKSMTHYLPLQRIDMEHTAQVISMTCLWNAPVAMPADAGTGEPPKRYSWDEDSVNWIEVQDGN